MKGSVVRSMVLRFGVNLGYACGSSNTARFLLSEEARLVHVAANASGRYNALADANIRIGWNCMSGVTRT